MEVSDLVMRDRQLLALQLSVRIPDFPSSYDVSTAITAETVVLSFKNSTPSLVWDSEGIGQEGEQHALATNDLWPPSLSGLRDLGHTFDFFPAK